SGDNRENSMLRSKYAAAETPTEVELKFENRGLVYTIRRNPEYMRPAKRGIGQTKQNADAQLIMPDGQVITGYRPVSEKVRNIIGVDRNQFSQIAMIAQGDFLKLLLAETKERQEIFREIFKTGYYRQLQKRLREESAELGKKHKEINASIEQYINGISCAENSAYTESVRKAKSNRLTIEEVDELIRFLLEEDSIREEKVREELEKCEKRLILLAEEKSKAEEYAALQKSAALKQMTAESLGSKKEQLALQLNNEKVKSAEYEKKAAEAVSVENQYADYDVLNAILIQQSESERKLNNAKNSVLTGREKAESLKAVAEALKAERKEKETAGENRQRLSAEKQRLENEKLRLTELKKGINALFRTADKYADAQKRYSEAYALWESKQQKYNMLNKAFLDEQAGILASSLTDGMPCPVCGSVHHPAKAQVSASAPTEDQVKLARKAADDAQAAATRRSNEASSLKGIFAAEKEVTDSKTPERFAGMDYKDIVHMAEQDVIKLNEELLKTEIAIKEEERNISRRQQLDNLIPEKEEELSALNTQISEYVAVIAAEDAKLQQLKSQQDTLKAKLRFENRQSAERFVLQLRQEISDGKKRLETATENFESCEKEIIRLSGEIQQIKQNLERLPQPDMRKISRETAESNSRKALLNTQRKNIHARTEINTRAKNSIAAKIEELSATEKKWTWVKALSNTANGEISGKEKIMLETYIQTTYFDRIIRRANTRFMIMTNGQYDLVRHESHTGGNAKSGLDLDVIDHYNSTTRSVNTLSGGESFKASLSLALGLSEEIQSSAGGIQLDTMFVDEGFGSLDGESLQQAINALTALSDGNRLVGIISHVAELKEKIDNQIVVKKEKSGGSRVQIIIG
ncbi:MAG: SMC family ATPase, partial [Oscillospiraceae bacterium]|nr:SMC family ATPase [Oscillospiraceae bacterium]